MNTNNACAVDEYFDKIKTVLKIMFKTFKIIYLTKNIQQKEIL